MSAWCPELKSHMKKLLYMFVFMVAGSVFGQDFSSSINTYLNSNQSELSLQSQDIEDIVIDRHSYSKSMDVENVYVVQQYQGIEIFNSNSSFCLRNHFSSSCLFQTEVMYLLSKIMHPLSLNPKS